MTQSDTVYENVLLFISSDPTWSKSPDLSSLCLYMLHGFANSSKHI